VKLNKAYKFRLYPNKEQQELMLKTFGSCRFVWNNKDLKQIKQLEGYEWLKDVDSISLQQTLNDLDTAFKNFYRKRKQGKPTSVRFKSKDDKQSYRTINVNNSIRIEANKIKLPKLGQVRFRDRRNVQEQIKSVTVSKTKTGKYFASILVEYEFTPNKPTQILEDKVFSADMSAKQFMVSEDMEFENQKFYRNSERRLRIRQRRLSRKQKGSNNRTKQKIKLASFHEQVVNKRRGFQRNLAHQLVSRFDVFCFEDLNMEGMQKFNKGLAKTVSMDFSWSEFLNFLEWKTIKSNKHLVKIDRWFPSSKMCSECGTVKEDLELSDRIYKCDCGFELDRDLNAARNIKMVGLEILKEQSGVNLTQKPTQLTWESYFL